MIESILSRLPLEKSCTACRWFERSLAGIEPSHLVPLRRQCCLESHFAYMRVLRRPVPTTPRAKSSESSMVVSSFANMLDEQCCSGRKQAWQPAMYFVAAGLAYVSGAP